jgi:homocysteine S-methyltransferase
LGVRNVFVVMGDLPHVGDYPNATAVSDITASGLMQLVNNFNQGIGINGKRLDEHTSFLIGCAVNLGAEDPNRELQVFEKKIAAGARFALTQPVYSPETVERWLDRSGGRFPIPVILGVLPLRSQRHAEFLHNEVPGIFIPDEVMARINNPKKNPAEEGIRLAQELLMAVRDKVAGAYFMPPFGKYEIVPEVLAGLH